MDVPGWVAELHQVGAVAVAPHPQHRQREEQQQAHGHRHVEQIAGQLPQYGDSVPPRSEEASYSAAKQLRTLTTTRTAKMARPTT